ncbi:MAG: PEP-CTERM sorting domain-containing protein, partial [Burkholderiales bacterium]|nr:PEP-CTERM sorting domain-containing protein [Burkholderiales bacterium]
RLDSVFFNTDLRVNEDATVNGAGTIALSNRAANRIYGATGAERLTIGAGQSIVGAGQIGLPGSNRLAVTNQGTIAAAGSNGLRLDMDGAAGAFANHGGLLEVRDGSFMRFVSGRFEGGTLRGLAADSQVEGSVAATLAGMNWEGTLTLRDGEGVGIGGTFSNTGTFRLNSVFFNTDLRVNEDATVNGAGTIVLSNRSANRIYGATGAERLTIGSAQTLRGAGQLGVNLLKITNQGTIIADQSNALTVNPTGADPLHNQGTVRVETGSQMTVSGSNLLQDASGAQTTVRGTLTVPQVDLVAGVLGGTGTIVGAVVNSGGIVAPGASPGKLVIQGNYTQGATGTLAIEIDGTGQGTSHDWLSVTGNAVLDGTLSLTFGYTPTPGTSYVILTTGSGTVSGTFTDIVRPAGWNVFATYHAKDVTLTVAAVPEPATYALLGIGLAVVGAAARRRRAGTAT